MPSHRDAWRPLTPDHLLFNFTVRNNTISMSQRKGHPPHHLKKPAKKKKKAQTFANCHILQGGVLHFMYMVTGKALPCTKPHPLPLLVNVSQQGNLWPIVWVCIVSPWQQCPKPSYCHLLWWFAIIYYKNGAKNRQSICVCVKERVTKKRKSYFSHYMRKAEAVILSCPIWDMLGTFGAITASPNTHVWIWDWCWSIIH